jgi:hypothetical protein
MAATRGIATGRVPTIYNSFTIVSLTYVTIQLFSAPANYHIPTHALRLLAMSSHASSPATLGNTPLLHLLASMADRRMSGTLWFETPDRNRGAVVFEGGTPRKTSAIAPNCRLSELLVEFGWLDRHSADETYAMALAQRQPHGRVLVDLQLVDAGGLRHVLLHQLIRKLDWLATRPPETSIGLHDDTDLLTNFPVGPDRVSALTILWGIAKSHVDEQNKRVVLQRVVARPLQLHARSVPELFGFNDAEMALVERLRHSRTDIGSLLYQVELPRPTAEALLYLLLLTRHIDIGDGRTPIGVGEPNRVPNSKASGEFSAVGTARHKNDAGTREASELNVASQLRQDLQQHVARAGSANHYALLGVAPNAPIGTIRDAFTTLARRYHPERLPVDLNDMRPQAAQLLTRMMAAYRVLADEEQRARYDRSQALGATGETSAADQQRLANRALSVDALRRAEQLLKRDRLLLAEAQAARALELAPDNPTCMALHAWIRALLPNGTQELEQILTALTKALDLEPMNVQTRFYRSEILKRLDRTDEAVGEWRLITELDPSNIDAQRELRLWEMRTSNRPPKKSMSGTHPQVSLNPPPTGLFGRLFKTPR